MWESVKESREFSLWKWRKNLWIFCITHTRLLIKFTWIHRKFIRFPFKNDWWEKFNFGNPEKYVSSLSLTVWKWERKSQVWVCQRRRAEVVNLNLTQYEFSIPPCINPKSRREKKNTKRISVDVMWVFSLQCLQHTYNSHKFSLVCCGK